ncbi:MAG: aminotransferase class V-fold PLP-dependent enzyme [Bacteroidales bacterium]|nr:aminotransferase class V-fold PLP-dependent enzyme [Bacteroidales bacterium]
MTTQELRGCFPQLSRTVYGKPLVYLDNAATSLRPQSVIDCWDDISSRSTANLHRAVHLVAIEATDAYENARAAVAGFINAADTQEVVFASGATHGLNLLAFSLGEAFIGEGDEIIVGEAEHHSNLVPWQMLCARKGAVLKRLRVDDSGRLMTETLPSLIGPKTKIVAVAHVSNVLGLVNPIREIADVCHRSGCLLVVDGAQGIVHQTVDVQALGCDFYAFSGHKMYAAPGTGVLWGRRELLEQMPPMFGGGEMIESVSWESSTYAPLPRKFEAGTQNISGTPTFSPAIVLMRQMPECEDVKSYVYESLTAEPGVRLFGTTSDLRLKVPVFSFAVEGAHHEDLALIMDKMGVALRSGQMCAEPLMDRLGVTGLVRASFAPYNTLQEAEYFISSLRKSIKMLR